MFILYICFQISTYDEMRSERNGIRNKLNNFEKEQLILTYTSKLPEVSELDRTIYWYGFKKGDVIKIIRRNEFLLSSTYFRRVVS